jgi:hypothetical protein
MNIVQLSVNVMENTERGIKSGLLENDVDVVGEGNASRGITNRYCRK